MAPRGSSMNRVALALLLAAPYMARADDPSGKRYALLVGVQDYSGTELTNLKFAESDVTAFAAVLRVDGYRLVTLMTKEEFFAKRADHLRPTAASVRKQLAVLLADRRPEDAVLVALSGHGV